MTDYFAGFPIAGFTKHFMVTYASESDTDALARANAILALCENDLQDMQTWFQCNFDQSPYAVWVHVAPGSSGGGAINFGYDGGQSSRIVINGTFQSNQPNTNLIRDEYARMLFVAEMSEVLMGFTNYGWAPGDSFGEALSRICAAELHPIGYYGPGGGPGVNAWLNSTIPRIDWISNPEGTDTDACSFGAGILFINFIIYQLGFPLSKIIPNFSGSLAKIYQKLTGDSASNGFNRFNDLINQHLPSVGSINVPRDNIFPLLDQPFVSFVVNYETLSSVKQPGFFEVTLQPGPLCPPQQYTYQIENVTTHFTVKAICHGLALPLFDWRLNGDPLPVRGSITNVPVSVTITDTTPAGNPAADAIVPIDYFISDGLNTSTLQFVNRSFPGNGSINISVSAHEAQVTSGLSGAHTDTWPLQMRSYDMDSSYSADLYRCNPHPIFEMSSVVKEIAGEIFIILNTPDPGPEQMLALARQLDRYKAALTEATSGLEGLQKSVMEVVNLSREATAAPKIVDLPGIADGRPVRALAEGAGEVQATAPRAQPVQEPGF